MPKLSQDAIWTEIDWARLGVIAPDKTQEFALLDCWLEIYKRTELHVTRLERLNEVEQNAPSFLKSARHETYVGIYRQFKAKHFDPKFITSCGPMKAIGDLREQLEKHPFIFVVANWKDRAVTYSTSERFILAKEPSSTDKDAPFQYCVYSGRWGERSLPADGLPYYLANLFPTEEHTADLTYIKMYVLPSKSTSAGASAMPQASSAARPIPDLLYVPEPFRDWESYQASLLDQPGP